MDHAHYGVGKGYWSLINIVSHISKSVTYLINLCLPAAYMDQGTAIIYQFPSL